MKRILSPLILLAALLAALTASAQDVRFEPRAIVVNPSPDFGVTVFVDKSGEVPSYRVGEEIRVSVRVDRDAYVYLYSLEPDGTVTQILPNRFTSDNRLRAGQTRTFPPSGAGYVFNVDPPMGLSKVVAVASTRQLDTEELARFESGQAFARSDIGERGFQRAFRIVVDPVPQNSWVTATTYYEVVGSGGGNDNAAQATLSIDSDPRGAEVYVEGRYVGTTPLRTSVQPGNRTVRLERDGYRSWERSFRVSPRETLSIDADLEAVPRTGTVRFESTPSGADVFVDGRFLGTTPIGAREYRPGRYDVDIELDGYLPERTTFRVEAGERRTVSVTLQPRLGGLDVIGNVGGARVFLDGREVGRLASGSGLLEIDDLQPGERELTLVAPGYGTVVTTVEVEAGRTSQIRLRQTRR
jgi:hypothetical protein